LPWQHLKPSIVGVYCALKGEIWRFKESPKGMAASGHSFSSSLLMLEDVVKIVKIVA
jgi:hypothetical protein